MSNSTKFNVFQSNYELIIIYSCQSHIISRFHRITRNFKSYAAISFYNCTIAIAHLNLTICSIVKTFSRYHMNYSSLNLIRHHFVKISKQNDGVFYNIFL